MGRNGNGWVQPQKKAVWRFLRTLNTDLLHGLASPLLVLDRRKSKPEMIVALYFLQGSITGTISKDDIN